MKKPTKKEIEKAREMVEELFLNKEWFELMRCWQGVGWHRSDVMAGLLVGMKIVENRKKQQSSERKLRPIPNILIKCRFCGVVIWAPADCKEPTCYDCDDLANAAHCDLVEVERTLEPITESGHWPE